MAANKPIIEQKSVRLPAPLGGLNSLDSVLATPPTDALMLDNFIIRAAGIEIRRGWNYWYDNAFGGEVRTLMSYTAADPSNNKLFAGVESGNGLIFDVSVSAATVPVGADVTPGSAADTPGEWHSTMFSTPTKMYLCAVSAGAGYWTYETTAGWVEVIVGGGAGQIQFPVGDASTLADMAFIMSWKNRLWFVHRSLPKLYYLPTGQIAGQLVAYDVGPLLRHGGKVAALTNWTYDAGSGIDDSLIIIGEQGDVLIYQGYDPASASTFQMRGVWFVGRVPTGRRVAAIQAGDVWIICEYGIIALSDIVSGKVTAPISTSSASGKYNSSIARLVSSTLSSKYWHITPVPSEEVLYCGTPYSSSLTGIRQSLLQSSINRGWSTVTNFDALCSVVHEGAFYFGTRDGYVCKGFVGYRDGDNWDGSSEGDEVTGQFLTGFFDYGSPTKNKILTRVRMLGLVDGEPSVRVAVRKEYEMQTLMSVSAPASLGSGALWDHALWDVATWQSGQLTFNRWIGIAGFGKKLALQVAVRGTGATLLTDYEVTFKEGYGL